MSIEVECLRCRGLLHFDDAAVGQQVRCPRCATVLTVPSPDPWSANVVPWSVAASGPATARGTQRAPRQIEPEPIEFRQLDATKAIECAWRLYKENLGKCTLSVLAVLLALLLFVLLAGSGTWVLLDKLDKATGGDSHALNVWIIVIGSATILLFASWQFMGLLQFNIRLARSGVARLSDLFVGRRLLSFFLVYGAVNIATTLGLLLGIAPGVIAMLAFFAAPLLVVDRKMSAGSALICSVRLARQNWPNIFLLMLAATCVALVAMILGSFCLVLGLVAAPYSLLVMVVGYLMLTGQRIANMERFMPAIPYATLAASNRPAFVAPPRIASRGKRLVNMMIDNVIVNILTMGMLFMVIIAFEYLNARNLAPGPGDPPVLALLIGVLVGFFVPTCYFILTEGLLQRSPAKFITGTKVVNVHGQRPTWRQIAGRTLARFIPFEPFSFLFGPEAIGWHDSLSDTRVIDEA
ncbi:MAG: RDD family protein [Planctomycetes bacterium]|nr:RDD family protein [Planctomycetota bacterium]